MFGSHVALRCDVWHVQPWFVKGLPDTMLCMWQIQNLNVGFFQMILVSVFQIWLDVTLQWAQPVILRSALTPRLWHLRCVTTENFQSLHMLVYIIGSLCVQKTWMTSCNSASNAPSRDEWARVTFPCWPRPFSKVTCSHSGEYCTWEPWGRDLLLDWFSIF